MLFVAICLVKLTLKYAISFDFIVDNERRVGDELQEITHTKVELREKRGKVTELEVRSSLLILEPMNPVNIGSDYVYP